MVAATSNASISPAWTLPNMTTQPFKTCIRIFTFTCMLLPLVLSGCGGSSAPLGVPDIAPVMDYIKASNTGTGDAFGFPTALSADGNTLAVGAFHEDSNATGINGDQTNDLLPDSGAVYVFTRTSGAWVQQAYIKASNTNADDWFGFSVSLSSDGNALAVGTPKEDSDAQGVNALNGDQSNAMPNAGAAYVFTRTAGVWSQQAYVKASNTKAGDEFGVSVALSGDGKTLAVGAYLEDSDAKGVDQDQTNNLAPDAGAVYVFTLDSVGTWIQQAYVKASNTKPDQEFGFSVALTAEGSTLAVGSPNESSDGSSQADVSIGGAGAAYVFLRDTAGSWTQQAYVKPHNPGVSYFFGSAIVLSGDGSTLAVSAGKEGTGGLGINSTATNNLANESGAVYVYSRAGALWNQQAYVKASNQTMEFGSGVALSANGNVMAVGSYLDLSNATGLNGDQSNMAAPQAGAAYLFTRSGATWRQRTYVKASNTGAGDWFGGSVALSADGRTLAIGAPLEDSHATGINGNQTSDSAMDAGAVYVLSMPN